MGYDLVFNCKQTELKLPDQQKTVTLRRIVSRLTDTFGRKSFVREIRDRLRPQHARNLIVSAESFEHFWNSAHESGTHLWISGTPPKEIYERLHIRGLLSGNLLSVLNVGVGEGYCEVDLNRKGHSVDALDISEIALKRVEKYVGKGFLSAHDLSESKYDLIIHHLVAQHMTHKELEEQLAQMVRSLKPLGLLAMQFASSQMNPEFNQPDNDKTLVMSGGVLRSKKLIKELVENSNGLIKDFYDKEDWLNTDCRFITAHITKSIKITKPDC